MRVRVRILSLNLVLIDVCLCWLQYESVGKKKMQVKSRKHWVQREMECDPTEQVQYANSAKSAMRGFFKK